MELREGSISRVKLSIGTGSVTMLAFSFPFFDGLCSSEGGYRFNCC